MPAPPPPDDPRSLPVLRARFGEMHRWWVLLTVMIGHMAALMAATTVNVAVPAISQQFGLGQQQAQWLATSFMGAMTVSMLGTHRDAKKGLAALCIGGGMGVSLAIER